MTGWPDPSSLPDLSDHQRERYAAATGSGGCLAILGGRPGTGKTFSLARILSKVPAGRSAVAAPTGKAAVRITESLRRAGVADIRATTIHSLLGPNRDEDSGEWSFEHDETNPLPLDWIFVDEASMCDTALLGSLLAARAPGCRVMLIGDVNQLSPVGHGAPLRDLIAAGLPYGELTEIRRNAGRIVRCCHGIVDRHQFEPSPGLDLAVESPENLIHVERGQPEAQIETLKTMLEKFRGGASLAVRLENGTIEQRQVDAVWQTQVLVPVNQKSPLARTRLNTILQSFLNPGGEQVKGNKFRVADKVVNGRNGYFPVETNIPRNLDGGPWNQDSREGKIYACNGDVGRVLAVFPRYTVARLWCPDRIIRIPHGEQQVDEDGEEIEGNNEWQLAYAISVHKAQGSQASVVITMADSYPGARMLCDRAFWYTALSRAETLAITVGQKEVIDDGIQKSHTWQRKTFLTEDIHSLAQSSIIHSWERALSE